MLSARDVLAKNRRDILSLANKMGRERLEVELRAAAKNLEGRLASLKPGMSNTFTEAQLRSTLVQVRATILDLQPGFKGLVIDAGMSAAEQAPNAVIDYLDAVEMSYAGVGAQPLALDEAAMMDVGLKGARSSILRRLATSGDALIPGAEAVPHQAKMGVLQRYGVNVINDFEEQLRSALVTRMPYDAMKAMLIEKSPFLQGKPAYWAERIVRTEVMNAYNASSSECLEEANEQLEDVVKILSATFDNRTAADSYAVHGQIRRTNEMFDTWTGQVMHPPARPNDREIIVPQRIAWPIAKYLQPRTRAEVLERWKAEGRKGVPPPNPEPDSTVDRRTFGA